MADGDAVSTRILNRRGENRFASLHVRPTYLSSTGVHALTLHVLRSLDDKEFRSGAALARAFGVSRGTIWNALADARALGVCVQRVHGRGYRLAAALDWLDPVAIRDGLAARGLTADVVDTCGSTNAELLATAERSAACRRLLAAELQTAGRGRLGRQWLSGLASALTFSMAWRFERSVAGLAGLSLAVGVAIARALRRLGACIMLKWPNDLVWQGRKLGGILIEVRGEALGPCTAVIGIGINTCLRAQERARIDQPVADLNEACAGPIPRTELLIALGGEVASMLAAFDRHGFADMRAAWSEYHAHRGQPVRIELPNGAVEFGTALGVDHDGRLRVDTADGPRTYVAGDVSLRSVHDARD